MSTMLDKLKKEAKQGLVDFGRGIEDLGHSPSTLTEITRVVQDFWRNEIEPQMKILDGTVKKGLKDFQKSFEEFQKDPDKTLEDGMKFFKDEAKKCKDAISNSPILKEFGKFLESAGNLVKAVLAGKEVTESWQKFKESATAVGSAIKEAALGKGKEGMAR